MHSMILLMRRRDLIEKGLKIVANYSSYDIKSFFIIASSEDDEEKKCEEKLIEFGDNIVINVVRLYGSS